MSLLPINVRSWLNHSDRYAPFFVGLASGARVSPCAESSAGFSCAKMGALSTPVTAASSKETPKEAGRLEVECMENPYSYAVSPDSSGKGELAYQVRSANVCTGCTNFAQWL